MNVQLTHRIILQRCGKISYEKGKAYHRARKVSFTDYNPYRPSYEATVKGSAHVSHHVTIDWDEDGMEATCTCPTLNSYHQDCQHIAAVLIAIHELDLDGRTPVLAGSDETGRGDRVHSAFDKQLTSDVLGLFAAPSIKPLRTRFDTRTPLEAEFVCKVVTYGYHKHMFGIELRIGLKRRYIVKKIKDFLEGIERGKPYEFSSHFTYDPAIHCFAKEDEEALRMLMDIYQNEKMYRETSSRSSIPNRDHETRTLLVPPVSWEKLQQSLQHARYVSFEEAHEGITYSDEPLPLHFSFDKGRSDDHYQMAIEGLEHVTVMESYGVAVAAGKLHKLSPVMSHRLSQLKSMLSVSRKNDLQISQEQMEPFMVQVVPELMKVGNVDITPSVSSRLVRTQLQARLYLDRIRDRLLAGLEFQYGDIVLNPLEDASQARGTDLIIMREGERERQILELMERSAFTRTESGYYMEDEEAEFDFLYRMVPQLEKLVKVYATTAVKVRLEPAASPPKIRVDIDEQMNWLECKFDIDGIPESEIRGVLRSLEEKRTYYRLPNGAMLPLEGTGFEDIRRFMNEMGIRGKDVQGAELRLPVVRGLTMMDTDSRGTAITVGKAFRRLLDNMRNPDNLDFPVPKSLENVLRDYQVYGYQWLKTLAHYHFGGVLADDMGLGKTVQSIAFLVSVLPEIRERKQPALIVSPASLVYNWRNELKKFAPDVRAVIADGTKDERLEILKKVSEVDVVITSYPLLRRDFGAYEESSFHTLILDEAQAFKNHTTQTAHAVKGIPAGYRFALTGTPVENGLDELWSIYDAVFPGLFPARKAFHELSREAVAKRVRPFLLRRVKTDVLRELPEKIETLQASALLPEQKKLYVAYLAKLQQETLKHLDKETFHQNRIKILAGLTRLRQLCCHPALFVDDYEGGSAKFEQLMEILEECRNSGRRVLLFSQFTKMLERIGREVGYSGVPFFYLDGDTPAATRVELCNRFNEGERDLFLASLKAGGTGLNLTGADTVILYDLWWNPAVEEQAADRAHRIGQKNVVQVIRLVAEGTVEEKMFELQQKKKNLIQEVIQPGQEALSSLTEQEIRELLML
ncbi:DEAD/DEAH box helicase [Brevibacillus choshinensis]|uniref:DEAD/DEAH box helicase n=1 Tax=Brevibacillus choshinensis TaxID=54911 RepID=A0ABX7FHI3_BRECH|nr:DEAD/DEAH box helicase [Brevibacillus choshinensis]QRG65612.1 DEAD/DEAH box helicase [Brevibacillus choshinensis]